MILTHYIQFLSTSAPGRNDKSTFDSYDRGSNRPLMWGVPRERIQLVETELSLKMRADAEALAQVSFGSLLGLFWVSFGSLLGILTLTTQVSFDTPPYRIVSQNARRC